MFPIQTTYVRRLALLHAVERTSFLSFFLSLFSLVQFSGCLVFDSFELSHTFRRSRQFLLFVVVVVRLLVRILTYFTYYLYLLIHVL